MTDSTETLDELLLYLHTHRGFDFSGYKRASLSRRIQKRLRECNVDSYADYIGFLDANPGEFALLFNTILINVTGFFRDELPWDYLQSEVLPRIIDAAVRRAHPGLERRVRHR